MDTGELVRLPDGSSVPGPLMGSQWPRLWVEPERHKLVTPGCTMCDLAQASGISGELIDGEHSGCGEQQALECLEWAAAYGYELDPWQKWVLTNMFSVRPNGLWAARNCLLIVPRQNGKGRESLTNRVYTRRGWTTFMDIQPGDEVIGSDGKFTAVIGRSVIVADAPCYEVEFADGAKVVVSDTHLWHVKHRERKLWQNVSTEDLCNSVGKQRPDNGRMEYNWRVRCDTVAETPGVDLPVDPYLLGYWLGDGHTHNHRITTGTEDYEWVRRRLYAAGARKGGWEREEALPEGPVTKSATGHDRHTLTFRTERAEYGPLNNGKHIPEIYLTASIAQRKALLAGLMDSDGSIAVTNKTPQCEFSTSFPALADGFHRLARSLGIRTTRKVRATQLDGVRKKDSERFLFTAPFCPFEMPRKAERWRPPASNRHEMMSIVAVRPVESVPTRCIKVAAPDGVYLTGELFTPTHNTILEVRELAGLFCVGEKTIIHTAHKFSTSVNHFSRLKEVFASYPDLSRQVKRIAGSHGEESIELFPAPTWIFGSDKKSVRRAVEAPTLKFHARQGSGGSRGFSADSLVYDEGMILSDESVGASLPTMRARPNPQTILAGSAGLDDSFYMAKQRKAMINKEPRRFGAEYSVNPHTEDCPRDPVRGREKNYYIICDNPLHDDRDDPRSWAKSNPATGYRVHTETAADELIDLPEGEFDREILGIGEWPAEEAPWEVFSEIAWRRLSAVRQDTGFPAQPIAFAADVDEDGKRATITAAWVSGLASRIVIEMPRNCSRIGVAWVLDELLRLYKKHRPVAIGLPRSGPGASLIEDGKKLFGERLVVLGSGDEAAAFAWFVQQVKDQGLHHFGEEEARTLWHAVSRAATRVVGDGGKAASRRDSEEDITPFTSALMAAWVLNKKRREYDPMSSIARST